MDNILFDIGIIIILASIAGFIAYKAKQPMILGYILMGMLLKPFLDYIGMGIDLETIRLLSEIGIAFLLFIVGLDLDLKKLKSVGGVASVGGIAQMALLFIFGFLVGLIFQFNTITSIYLGIIVMFSSTMVVLKILSDKKQIDTLHSRIIIGTLIMQDVIAIIILSLLNKSNSFEPGNLIISLFSGIALIGLAYILTKFVFPKIFKTAAESQEILFMISLAVFFTFAFLFHIAGFSIAIGAFIAGVTIGNLPYNIEIAIKIKPLRDFFSVLFFATLGMGIIFTNITQTLLLVAALLVIVIFIKPLIIMMSVALFGYKKRVSFMTGISMAQISEFVLILAAQGFAIGHISQEIYTATILLAVISITTTSYFIQFEQKIYYKIAKHIKILDKFGKKAQALELFRDNKKHTVILCGYNRVGYSIFNSLQKSKKDFVVVDFNPEVIKSLINRKIPCMYGDLSDPDVLEAINFDEVELVISTIPDLTVNLMIIKEVKTRKKNAKIILTAYKINDALTLYKAGADYVIIPHLLGGEHVSLMLEKIGTNIDELIKTKLRHINELHLRKNLM